MHVPDYNLSVSGMSLLNNQFIIFMLLPSDRPVEDCRSFRLRCLVQGLVFYIRNVLSDLQTRKLKHRLSTLHNHHHAWTILCLLPCCEAGTVMPLIERIPSSMVAADRAHVSSRLHPAYHALICLICHIYARPLLRGLLHLS